MIEHCSRVVLCWAQLHTLTENHWTAPHLPPPMRGPASQDAPACLGGGGCPQDMQGSAWSLRRSRGLPAGSTAALGRGLRHRGDLLRFPHGSCWVSFSFRSTSNVLQHGVPPELVTCCIYRAHTPRWPLCCACANFNTKRTSASITVAKAALSVCRPAARCPQPASGRPGHRPGPGRVCSQPRREAEHSSRDPTCPGALSAPPHRVPRLGLLWAVQADLDSRAAPVRALVAGLLAGLGQWGVQQAAS